MSHKNETVSGSATEVYICTKEISMEQHLYLSDILSQKHDGKTMEIQRGFSRNIKLLFAVHFVSLPSEILMSRVIQKMGNSCIFRAV